MHNVRNASIRSIQTRLFLLLLRAFIIVVLLTLGLLLVIFAFFLTYPTRFYPGDRMPFVTRLQTFYLVRGDWKGVNVVVGDDPRGEDRRLWENAVLVGPDGKVILYHGRTDAMYVGQPLVPDPNNTSLPIRVEGRDVGNLVLQPAFFPYQGRAILGTLAPVGLISIFLALLTVVIGLLLMRRFVNPLAEVIAAAGSVAGGNLASRVNVSGPSDLRALSDSFNHMADSLERSDRERRDMLADIAHELRTPLTVMRGRLEGMVDGIYPSNAEQIVPALEETYLLERLVEDLRLLTLAETHQLHFEQKSTDLGALADRVRDLFQAEAQEKKIELTLERGAGDLSAPVDPQRAEQVLGNLVSNSLRYIHEGGTIRIAVSRDGDRVRIGVTDDGPGVPEEDLARIFNRFWRGEKSRARSSGGAGLGLAIAKQLVEGQGGAISAENVPGGGLRITCEFLAG